MKAIILHILIICPLLTMGQSSWKKEIVNHLNIATEQIQTAASAQLDTTLDSLEAKIETMEMRSWPGAPRRRVILMTRTASDLARQCQELLEFRSKVSECFFDKYESLQPLRPVEWPAPSLARKEIKQKLPAVSYDLEKTLNRNWSLQRESIRNSLLIDSVLFTANIQGLKYLERLARRMDSTQYVQLSSLNKTACESARSQIDLRLNEVSGQLFRQVSKVKSRFRKQWRSVLEEKDQKKQTKGTPDAATVRIDR